MQENLDRFYLDSGLYQPELRTVVLTQLVKPVVEKMKQQAKIKGINLCEVSMVDQKQVSVVVDKHRIQHTLQNLIMKQIEQTDAGGNVVVQINEHRLDEHSTSLKFCLINDEEFLDERDLTVIYNMAAAVYTDSEKQIELAGLNQCNQSIKQMGGSMDIRSGQQGCTIVVTLPVQLAATRSEEVCASDFPSISRVEPLEKPDCGEIIIVEELLINRELLKGHLKDLHYLHRCMLLNHGAEAFAKAVEILS